MQNYFQEFKHLSSVDIDPKNDKSKIKLLNSLLVIHKNYMEMRKYAQHNYPIRRVQSEYGIDRDDLRHGSFILSRSITTKTSRSFSLFSKKKICK